MSDEKKTAAEPPVETPPQADQDVTSNLEGLEALIGPEQLKAMIEALQGEVDKKSAELALKHDAYLRAVAETENVRRRLEKEKEETARYAISKFAKDILTVGDNFQRTVAAVPQAAVATDPALKTLLEGILLAEKDYRGALERHGVRSIEPLGQPFNPHQQQAVMEREDASVPVGTVLQVFQMGYMIDDRCLRPAMVVVSSGGPKAVKSGDAPTPDTGTADPDANAAGGPPRSGDAAPENGSKN